ncbi:MAG: hypothetical protein GY774_16510 [Planctomycetes bacterium]|nr:hypothetical protein [Planctomycetota bacterium]
MNITTTENAIIAELEAQITTAKVEGYPDDPLNYNLKHPNGALLVQYQGSSYTEPVSYVVEQKQKALFDIFIITKNLRTHTGAYAYLESVKTILTGFEITGLARLYPVQEQFLSDVNGIWRYGITFALNTTHEEA